MLKRLSSSLLAPLGSAPSRYVHLTALSCGRFKLSLTRTQEDEGSKLDVDGEDENKESYLKSHPYRQICTWDSVPELAKVLIENQIHNDHGLFVTNKPFGVGVRNQTFNKSNQELRSTQLHVRGLQLSPYTLEDALPELRISLNKPKLTLVNSASKLVSGVAVFADDEKTGERFSKAVKSSKGYFGPLYNYHIVTTLPPLLNVDPENVERLGLAVKTGIGSDVPQPVLFREFSNNSVKRQELVVIKAKTKLVKSGYNTGYLVQVNTSRVGKNFLRIHCAEKLAPILGDQLYSARVRLLKGIPTKIDYSHLIPGTSFQQLSTQLLDLLKLKRLEDSLMVPAHIHLRSYKIKKFLGQKGEMEFEAPYPPYFKWTCEQLGISLYEEPI